MVSLYSWFPYIHCFLIFMGSLYSWFPYIHSFLIFMGSLYSWFSYIHSFLIFIVSLYSWVPYIHGFLIFIVSCNFKLFSFFPKSLNKALQSNNNGLRHTLFLLGYLKTKIDCGDQFHPPPTAKSHV